MPINSLKHARRRARKLDPWNARRAAIPAFYIEALADCGLTLPHVIAFAEPAWHLYVVQSGNRDRHAERLAEGGARL